MTIIDLDKGGPKLTSTITVEEKKEETKTSYLYKGVDNEGWYWIEDIRHSLLHSLDQELFFELLAEVSDYEV